ncbi:MAG: molecular chaperone TorD family protein [Motiliproteus sp.]
MFEFASDAQPTDTQSSACAQLSGTAMQVSYLYAFLAGLYRAELSQSQLRALRAPEMRVILTAAGISLDSDFWTKPESQILEDLAVEYTALFLGPGGHISPHESVQIEQQGSYWGDATTAVRAFITATGIEYSASYQGIPDHISVELEFLAELSKIEGIAWQRGDSGSAANSLEYQGDFIDEHLGQWLEKFCAQVVETAELSFYRDLAQVTTEFVTSEIEAIKDRLKVAKTLSDRIAPDRNATDCVAQDRIA